MLSGRSKLSLPWFLVSNLLKVPPSNLSTLKTNSELSLVPPFSGYIIGDVSALFIINELGLWSGFFYNEVGFLTKLALVACFKNPALLTGNWWTTCWDSPSISSSSKLAYPTPFWAACYWGLIGPPIISSYWSSSSSNPSDSRISSSSSWSSFLGDGRFL